MPPDAPSYVPRAADEDTFQAIRKGEFCYLLTPSQMGKSSLMIRTKARLEKEGRQVTAFSLEAIGYSSIKNPEQLYFNILYKIGVNLGMEDELTAFWDDHTQLSPLQRFMKSLDLAARRNPKRNAGSSPTNLVVMIDEIGLVRKLAFPTGELFGAIREVHSNQSGDRSIASLTFCLLGTATPSELVDDPATTPFRLGHRIDLRDFTLAEAMQLARGLTDLGIDRPTAEAILRRVHHWTNGHPRLTQRLCGRLAETYLQGRTNASAPAPPIPHPVSWVDDVCENLLFAGNPLENDDSLACVHDRLLLRAGAQLADLLDLYRRIRAGRRVPDDKHDPLVSQLLLSGIVRSERGRLAPRNRIYRRAFDREWIRSNMPQAELRREREAWRRGVAVTTALGCTVAAAFAVLLSLLFVQIQRKQAAWANAQFNLARMIRMAAQSHALARFTYPASFRGAQTGPRLSSLLAISNAVPHYADHKELASETASILTLPDLKPVAPPGSTAASVPPMLIDPRTGTVAGPLNPTDPHAGATHGVVRQWLSPDARLLASLATNANAATLAIIALAATNQILEIEEFIPAPALAFRPDSAQVAIIRQSRSLQIYDLSTTNAVLAGTLPPKDMWMPSRIQYQPDGPWLAEASQGSQTIHLRNPATGETQSLYDSAPVLDFAWHPSGRALAAVTARQTIFLELVLGTNVAHPAGPGHWMELETDLASPAALTFNHRGDMLACLDGDRRVLIWMPWSNIPISFRLLGRSFDFLRFSSDDRRLDAVCSRTGLCQSWEVLGDDYHALPTLCDPRQGQLRYLALDSSGDRLIAGGSSGFSLFDLDGPSWSGHFQSPNAASAFFVPGTDDVLVASRESGLLRIRPRRALPGDAFEPTPGRHEIYRGQVSAAAPLPGARVLLALPMRCVIVDQTTGETSAEIATRVSYDRLVASRDGRWFAARHAGGTRLDLWSIQPKHSASRAPRSIEHVDGHFDFTPDNALLVFTMGGGLSTLSLEGAVEENQPRVITNVFENAGAFALGPAGLIAVGESASKIALCRFMTPPAPSFERLLTLDTPDASPIVSLIFTPKTSQLIALDRKQAIHIWHLDRIEAQFESLGLRILPFESTTQRAKAP